MKRLLPALALLGLTASAQCVDTDQAQAIAASFFQSHRQGPARAQSTVAPVLAYTAETEGTPSFYVFNRSETAQGFVIINADSTTDMPIIGYSETSSFDPDNLPDNFRWWLEQYEGNGVAKAPLRAPQHRADQGPLLRTQWAQEDPFNSAIRDTKGDQYVFVTGCTATSMAQIMKYYEYPTRGTGSNTYTVHYSNGDLSFSANFGATTYDWASMLDVYEKDFEGNPKNYNSTQANAVAKLMFHAGVAEDVVYSSESSGASDRSSAQALINHFSYDKSMLRAERKYYTDEEWDDIIYSEIAAGRPVMYSGTTTKDEGHSFLIHGYRASDGLYAINWGWGGLSDGYFALQGTDALRPNTQGTGGAHSGLGFSERQTINYNIRPNQGGQYAVQLAVSVPQSTPGAAPFKFGTDPKLASTISSYTVNRAASGDRTLYYDFYPCNVGFADVTMRYGVILRHTITGQIYTTWTYAEPITLEPLTMNRWTNSGPEPFSKFSTTILPYNGTYEVLPACSTDNGATWFPIRVVKSFTLPTITITGGADAQRIEVPFEIEDTQVEYGKTISITHPESYTGKVTYTSSNPAVAMVDAFGVVSGRDIGHAQITAVAEGDTHYLPTTKAFTIHVTNHIIREAEVNITETTFNVGDRVHITHPADYTGKITYTATPAGIVSISSDGTITALAEGYATIRVQGELTFDYKAFDRTFNVTVKGKPALTKQLCFTEYPVIGTENIASPDNFALKMKIRNNSGATLAPAEIYIKATCNGGIYTLSTGYASLPADYEDAILYDLAPIKNDFIPGNTYTLDFYLDEAMTRPMNCPHLTYYYGFPTAQKPEPTCSDLARIIAGAKTSKDGKASLRLIETMIRNILGM